jgi:hypothetical protein
MVPDYESTHAFLNKDDANTDNGKIAAALAEKETKQQILPLLVLFHQQPINVMCLANIRAGMLSSG